MTPVRLARFSFRSPLLLLGLTALLCACHPFEDTKENLSDTMDGTSDGTGDTDIVPDGGGDMASDMASDTVDAPADLADGTDMTPGECTAATECEPLYGPAPCGSYECNAGQCEVACPGCDTDMDRDGYGAEAACAGPDCDDDDDTIGANHVQSCYGGPPGTESVGVCRRGTEECISGRWLPCIGEVLPGGEACNMQDDDCNGTPDDVGQIRCGIGACQNTVDACASGAANTCTPLAVVGGPDGCDGIDSDCDGAVDEDCPSACIWVTRGGNDSTATGAQGAPFQTIQTAIDYAATPGVPQTQVCVVGGSDCSGGSRYVYNVTGGALQMRDGISVLGSYRSSDYSQCPSRLTTVIAPTSGEGVKFDSAVQSLTVLDGFEIQRFAANDTAGVTVDGATNVVLSNLTIINNPNAQTSRGILLLNNADALVTQSSVIGGNGAVESTGIHVKDSRIDIVDNCPQKDAQGRCATYCSWNNTADHGIRAHQGSRINGSLQAVWLENAPGSLISESAVCGGAGDESYGIRIEGDGSNIVVRANHINAFGGTNFSYPVFSAGCGGASPRIADNNNIIAETSAGLGAGHGIHVEGDCHPVIDNNTQIAGGGEGPNAPFVAGIYCGQAGGVSSQCTILNNASIIGALPWGVPLVAVGVECQGGCSRIEGNLIEATSGDRSIGLHLGGDSAMVANNDIRGGCPGNAGSTGLLAEDSSARIENNRLMGGRCEPDTTVIGLEVLISDAATELDVHSNIIDGGGNNRGCDTYAIWLDEGPSTPVAPSGTYRNNILRTWQCSGKRYHVWEADNDVDPRVFENNLFEPGGTFYEDADTGPRTSIDQVNNLVDIQSGYNITVDPQFVNYPTDYHVNAGSPVDAAGTPTGAPAVDMDGQMRDATTPDVGPDEL